MLRKNLTFLILMAGAVLAQTNVPADSPTPVFKPALVTLTATCTSTCPKQAVNGQNLGVLRIAGTHSAFTLQVQGTNDSTNFTALQVTPVNGGTASTTMTTDGIYWVNLAAMTQVKYSLTVLTGTNVTIQLTANAAPSSFVIQQDNSSAGGGAAVTVQPTASSTFGIAPVASTTAESGHVLKNAAGNLYDAYATIGSTAGWLMVFNATTVPADGAVTPLECVQVPPNTTQGIAYPVVPEVFSVGISMAFSTTGCSTKTASATAFFHGRIQ